MSRDEAPESFQSVAEGMEVLNRLAGKIWPRGARLFCVVCGYEKEKTSEEMAAYLNGWPKCKGTKIAPHKPLTADVKPL